jgi:DNA ligase-1
MRCSTIKQVPLERLNWKDGVYAQDKADGEFVNITVKENVPTAITTRNGQPFPEGFGGIEMLLYSGYQYHGEALVVNLETGVDMPRKKGNGKLTSVLKGGSLPEGHEVRFVLWDMITLTALEDRLSSVPYQTRWEGLKEVCKGLPMNITLSPTMEVFTIFGAESHFFNTLERGGEGLILKDKSALWKNGTSQMQVKMKDEKECELFVEAIHEGKGKYVDCTGAIGCCSDDSGIRVNVSGFTDDERKDIWENKENWLGTIVSVKFNEVISSKSHGGAQSLFLPRFVERRNNKHEADTTEYIVGL